MVLEGVPLWCQISRAPWPTVRCPCSAGITEEAPTPSSQAEECRAPVCLETQTDLIAENGLFLLPVIWLLQHAAAWPRVLRMYRRKDGPSFPPAQIRLRPHLAWDCPRFWPLFHVAPQFCLLTPKPWRPSSLVSPVVWLKAVAQSLMWALPPQPFLGLLFGQPDFSCQGCVSAQGSSCSQMFSCPRLRGPFSLPKWLKGRHVFLPGRRKL